MMFRRAAWLGLFVALVACTVFALTTGAMKASAGDVVLGFAEAFGWVGRGSVPPELISVLVQVRTPRVIATVLVGAVLGVSGATMQGLFRNPLAEPGLIGVMAGASLGAAAAIVLVGPGGWLGIPSVWLTPIAAFIGGSAATGAALLLARGGASETSLLLLSGVAIQAIAFAGVGLLTYMARDAQLRDLTFWMLGSFSGATWSKVFASAPALLLALAAAPLMVRPLDAMLLGEDAARDVGVSPRRVKIVSVAATSLGIGAAVAIAGPVSFVGLVVPHVVRIVGGVRHSVVVPGAALLGATLMVAADTAARTVAAPAEVPVGIITAMVGAPAFAWLLRRLHWPRTARS